MKKKLILLVILTALFLTGCKSLFTREGTLLSDARKAEKRGDYYTAVINSMESVRIDNEYKKAIAFLKEVYPKANSYYSLEIDKTRSSGSKFSNDDIARYYRYLKDMNESARTLPQITDPDTKLPLSFSYIDYTADLKAANEAAAEDHYNEGIKFSGMKGRENAKAAAEEFETALAFVPGYRDAEQKASAALEQAVQILAFFPFANNAWNIPTTEFADIMETAAVSALMDDPQVMKYTRIIDKRLQQQIMQEQAGSLSALMNDESRVEIGQLLNANILITGTLDSAVLEGPSTTMTQYHRTANIEVDESEATGYYKDSMTSTLTTGSDSSNPYYKDGKAAADNSSDITVYGTREVDADIFYYKKIIRFEVLVSYKAVDVETGTILKNDTIRIKTEDVSKWAVWSGDERALNREDKQLVNRHEEPVKSARQLASDAAEEAGVKIAEGLASFLK